MEYTIYTYGHLDALYHTLNALAIMSNCFFTDKILQACAILSIASGIFSTTFETAINRSLPRTHMIRAFKIVLIIHLLFIPKGTIYIKDHISKQFDHVDNLPAGFVVPIGMIEFIGDAFSRIMEQSFSSSRTFSYRNYGPIFGASLINEVKNIRFQNPTFVQNMGAFIDRCVISTALIGKDFSIDNLMHSTNIWDEIIKPKMKDGIREVILYRKNGSTSQVGCKTAADELESIFDKERSILDRFYLFKNYGQANASDDSKSYNPRGTTTINSFFENNVKSVFGNYFGLSQTGAQILHQVMLMNSFSKYADYGTIRAMQHQESSWKIAGNLGTYYLPMQLTVVKCLLYGVFIFVLVGMVLSGNLAQFKNYLIFVASFQLWPALFAILNMIIDLGSAIEFRQIGKFAVSLSTFSKVGYVSDMIVGVAGISQFLIPYMALSIVRGGYETFTQMGAYIQSSITAASASSASEVISGNRSFDNVSIRNVSGFKTDLNASYAAGASSYQNSDGSISKVTSDGTDITFTDGSKNKFEGKFTLRASSEKGISDAVSKQNNLVDNISTNYSNAKTSAEDQMGEMLYSITNHMSEGHVNSDTKQLFSNQDIQTVVGKAYEIHKNQNVSMDKALKLSISGAAGIGFDKIVNAFAQLVGDASASSSHQNNIGKNDALSENQTITGHDGISHNQSSEESLSKTLGISKDQLNRFNTSVGKVNSLQDQYHVEKSKLETLESKLHEAKSSGGYIEMDVTDAVVKASGQKLGKTNYEIIQGLYAGNKTILNTTARVLRNMQDNWDNQMGVNVIIDKDRELDRHNALYNVEKDQMNIRYEHDKFHVTDYGAKKKYNDLEFKQTMKEGKFKNDYDTESKKIEDMENAINSNRSDFESNLENKKKRGIIKNTGDVIGGNLE